MKCEKCGELNQDKNYCCNCGNPLTKLARQYEIVKQRGIKLELLLDLSEKFTDEKSKDAIKLIVKNL